MSRIMNNEAYERGYAVWLVDLRGNELVAWSPKLEVARAAFDAAEKEFPGKELSMRQRGRVLREVNRVVDPESQWRPGQP